MASRGVSTAQELSRQLRRQGRVRVALDWTLDMFLPRDVTEIQVQRTRTRPGTRARGARDDQLSV